ncbi:MAG: ATP-grasp domain-containing protein [Terriglobia bacterium]
MSFAGAIAAAKPDLVVPCDDLATQHLHHLYYRELVHGNAGGLLCGLLERSLGSPESFSLVHARAKFMELAGQEGVRAPKTQVIKDTNDLRHWIEAMGFPTVLKTNGSSGGYGVRVINTMEEAERAFHALKAPPLMARAVKRAVIDGDWTLVWPSIRRRLSVVNAQDYVPGREATSAAACWKGAVLAVVHFEVLSKMDPTGPATVLRRFEHPEMSGSIEKMVRRLNLSGIHGFDFMLEANTGNACLIEINPRAPQVGHLTFGLGRDLPAALYSAVSGHDIHASDKVTDNDTIALFPHEWMRDPLSQVLQSGYNDVPWEEPGLLAACVRKPVKRGAWHLQKNRTQTRSAAQVPRVKNLVEKPHA